METIFEDVIRKIALMIEAFSAIIITIGAVQAMYRTLYLVSTDRRGPLGREKDTWLRFGVWLLFGLEFELAADILRTIISPSWTELGQLGAIALIRTFINFFLERDIEHYAARNALPVSPKERPGN